MARSKPTTLPDLLADPFRELPPRMIREPLQLLGGRFRFETNSRELLRLVDSAYAGLPRHRLPGVVPRLRVGLLLSPPGQPRPNRRLEPPALNLFSAAGFLGGTTHSSDVVAVAPREKAALVVVSPKMLRSPYHTRCELIDFAVLTLAARAQGLVSLHAACVGRGGHGILLMGSSGAGKSTVALQCLLQGLDFLSEDAVFVAPDTLRATGIANFLHVRADSLRWVERPGDAAPIRDSPVIRRRSGVKKFELDLRHGGYRLAPSPLRIGAVVFLSAQKSHDGPLLRPLSKSTLLAKLANAQAYAANQPGWTTFAERLSDLGGFELRRGRHPLEAVGVLQSLLARRTR
jgi:hypothetical protein